MGALNWLTHQKIKTSLADRFRPFQHAPGGERLESADCCLPGTRSGCTWRGRSHRSGLIAIHDGVRIGLFEIGLKHLPLKSEFGSRGKFGLILRVSFQHRDRELLIGHFLIFRMLIFHGPGDLMAVSMTYHFLGGFFMAMLIYSFYHSEFSKLSQPTRFLVVVMMTLAVGAFWEMAEYMLHSIGDLDDTIQDLVMDTIGALVFCTITFLLGLLFPKGKARS